MGQDYLGQTVCSLTNIVVFHFALYFCSMLHLHAVSVAVGWALKCFFDATLRPSSVCPKMFWPISYSAVEFLVMLLLTNDNLGITWTTTGVEMYLDGSAEIDKSYWLLRLVASRHTVIDQYQSRNNVNPNGCRTVLGGPEEINKSYWQFRVVTSRHMVIDQ